MAGTSRRYRTGYFEAKQLVVSYNYFNLNRKVNVVQKALSENMVQQGHLVQWARSAKKDGLEFKGFEVLKVSGVSFIFLFFE